MMWKFWRPAIPIGYYPIKKRALTGLETLGREAQPAAPALARLIADTNEPPDFRLQAFHVLFAIYPKPSEVLPALDLATNDPDGRVRGSAISAARSLRREPNLTGRFAWLEWHAETNSVPSGLNLSQGTLGKAGSMEFTLDPPRTMSRARLDLRGSNWSLGPLPGLAPSHSAVQDSPDTNRVLK